MRYECYFCHTRTIENLIHKFQPEEKMAEEFIFAIQKLLANNRDLPNPYLATLIHRMAREKLNHKNLYHQEKVNANQLLLNQYDEWKQKIADHPVPLNMAAKLAVAGNIVDYGSHSVEDDIRAQIDALLVKDFAVNHSEDLFHDFKTTQSILYLGDNAGEIVFDRLFIETMNHPDVTYVVRDKPVINDVTEDDARQVKMHEICKVISNGYDAPSTLLEHSSSDFIHQFEKAGVIISKGQGNFEGLMHCYKENIYFMLMAKCKPIAELLDVNIGDLIIKSGKGRNNEF